MDDLPSLARNFVIGGVLAAGYTLVRAARTKHGERNDELGSRLDPPPANAFAMHYDMLAALRDISKCCARVPDASQRPAFRRHVRTAIRALDDLVCIEVQLNRGEIEPEPIDWREAQRLAMDAMRSLRATEPMLASSQLWFERIKQHNDVVQECINTHLGNINKHVFGRH